ALPLLMEDGTAFPKRRSIIFLSFVVIFVTLVVQGLSLPLLIRLLGVKPAGNENQEEKELKLFLANSTLHFIDHEFPIRMDDKTRDHLKKKYEKQVESLTKEIRVSKKRGGNNKDLLSVPINPLLTAQIEVNKFQHDLLVKLHKEGTYSDEALKKVEFEKDIDNIKLDIQLPKEET
ncbi:MAG: Na+/H+ antiporter, partial [Panacibacter sp.]